MVSPDEWAGGLRFLRPAQTSSPGIALQRVKPLRSVGPMPSSGPQLRSKKKYAELHQKLNYIKLSKISKTRDGEQTTYCILEKGGTDPIEQQTAQNVQNHPPSIAKLRGKFDNLCFLFNDFPVVFPYVLYIYTHMCICIYMYHLYTYRKTRIYSYTYVL